MSSPDPAGATLSLTWRFWIEAACPWSMLQYPTPQTSQSLFEAKILQQLPVKTRWRVLGRERGIYLFVLYALS